jgi:hypothetical protein
MNMEEEFPMRPDLIVPGEHEEEFAAAHDTRVVTVPFSPLEKRMAKEKPQLMPGLKVLREELGDAEFERLITRIHNINVADERCLIVAESELHRTFILRDALPAIAKAFHVTNIRVVTQG